MASNGNVKSGLLTAGGILSILAGVFEITIIWCAVASVVFYCEPFRFLLWPFGFSIWPLPNWFPPMWCVESHNIWAEFPTWFIIMGGLLVVLGIVAIAGGVSAIRRKKFGLSLTGAICALPSVILGILAVIFVALGKREFGAKV
jgi:hypothetical protein